jgi:ATP phosphoribosyltransferase
VIRLGLPRGRMAADSDTFCRALGVTVKPGVLSYSTRVGCLPVSIFLLRAPDVARMLRRNYLDLGLTGDEWLMETGVPPDRRCFEARSYEASICLLMAEADPRHSWHIRSVVTPYPNLAGSLLREIAPDAEIITVSGSTEGLVPDIADACLDVVETGTSAALNGLVIRESFERVTTHLVRSEGCDQLAAVSVIKLLADARRLVR